MTAGGTPAPEARRIEVDRGAAIELRLFAPTAGPATGAVLIGGATLWARTAGWLSEFKLAKETTT